MSVAPSPAEIFERAVEEGDRRLDQSMLELLANAFIAGFTIVFGIAALGLVHALVKPEFGDVAKIAGSLAFAPGLVFLVVGRAELFNENFFDPIAAAFDADDSWLLGPLARLWAVTFVLNFVGGILFTLVFAVEGVLPSDALSVLATIAEELIHRSLLTTFADAIVGGALVTLLSFLLEAVNGVGSRIALAYGVGFLLALGPFGHVVVTGLHVLFGMFVGAPVGYGELGQLVVVVTAGNLVGGVGLVTLTHVAQVWGAEE